MANEHSDHQINIFVDKKHIKVAKNTLTGAEIKTLGNVPPGYELWQEVPGDKDILVNDTDRIEIKSGMKFFSTKPTIDPGVK
jgi:hypothetical protein